VVGGGVGEVVPGAAVVAPGAAVVAPGAKVVTTGAEVVAPGAEVVAPGAAVLGPGVTAEIPTQPGMAVGGVEQLTPIGQQVYLLPSALKHCA
jgi:hypothetical protein